MKILAFGASYSSSSINKTFAAFAASKIKNAEVEILDLRQFDLPLFTVDKEQEIGLPDAAREFLAKLDNADLLVISMAEHNGSYTTAFKNLFDWTSRVKLKMFENKKMILLSTAPGPRGGKGAMDAAFVRFPIHGANILTTFTLPKFGENFSADNGIINEELNQEFNEKINSILLSNAR
ncbi:MAG: NAD(P)H-dependent oxidoreductase [Bacteroidetes bacterium]|nr:NAD(P)H-dependent oxidoreductase [Bacteroidota bacterium]